MPCEFSTAFAGMAASSLAYNSRMETKLSLPGVTLISVSAVEIEKTLAALKISSEHIAFGAVKLLSPTRPASLPPTIEHVLIPPIDFLGYSRFIIRQLHEHVDTEHCLIIQADGFVINPRLWRDEFLAFDYVGAPWPERVALRFGDEKWFYLGKNRVGNGGFSLRSRKLLQRTAKIDFDRLPFPLKSEDLVICHYLYEEMLDSGIAFAPIELAQKFAIESPPAQYRQELESVFGFHGKHWLRRHLLRRFAEGSDLRQDFDSLLLEPTPPRIAANPPVQAGSSRLAPCTCGSGKRFKDCHGRLS